MLETFPKVTLLVHSGCYNKALQFVWLKPQKLIFSQFLKLESLRSRFWQGLVSGEGSPPGLLMTCILLCSLMTSPSFSGMEGDRQTDLFLGAVTLGVKASTCEFWRNTMPQHGHVQEVVEVVVVVSKLCLTLATSYCSMPGFSALHYLLKFAQGRKLKEVVEPDSMPGLLPPEPEFLLITHFSLTGHISTHYFYFLKKKKKKAIIHLPNILWTLMEVRQHRESKEASETMSL